MSACSAVAVRRSSTTTSVRPVGGQAQALEQPRVRRDRIGAPDHHDLGAVADVAERGRARAAGLEGEAGGAVEDRAGRVDRRADRVRQRDGGALRLARRAARARRRAARAPGRGSPPPRRAPRRAAPRGRRRGRVGGAGAARSANQASPSGHVRSRRSIAPSAATTAVMSSHTRPQPAQVAACRPGAPAASGDGIDRGVVVELGAQRRRARPRGRRAPPPATVRSRRACRSGWPVGIASSGWGTSRIPRLPSRGCPEPGRPRSRTRSPSRPPRAASAGAPAPAGARRRPRRAPRTGAPRAPRAIVSSDAVGRGLTSTTHARPPSQTRSTPNSPRRPKAVGDVRADRRPPRGPARRARPPAAAAGRRSRTR